METFTKSVVVRKNVYFTKRQVIKDSTTDSHTPVQMTRFYPDHSCFFLLFLWLVPVPAAAQSVISPDTLRLISPIDSFVPLASYATVLVDSSASLNWQEALEQKRRGAFFPLEDLTIAEKFTRGRYNYWLSFTIRNDLPERLPNMYFQLAPVDSISLYVFSENEPFHLITAGKRTHDLYERTELPFSGKNDIPFTFAPRETYTYLVRLQNENSFPAKLEPALVDPAYHIQRYEKGYRHYYTFFGGFFALLLFLAVFTLAQYFQNYDRAFLFYALYILSLFFFYLRQYDLRNQFDYVFPLFIHDHRFYSVFGLSIYIAYFAFIDHFLGARRRFPWLHRFIRAAILIFVAFMLLDQVVTTFDPLVSWRVNYNLRIGIGLASLGILLWLLRTRDRLALYIVVGTLLLICGNLVTIAVTVLEVFEEGWWDLTQIPAFIGIVAELLLFSTVLGYRQRLAEQEKVRVEKELFEKESEARYLERMSREKANFFTNMTHEFRTPLTIIQGMAREIKHDQQSKRLILQNSDRLLNLVNQLLDLAKVGAGSLPLHLVQSDIINYLSYLTESLHSLAFSKKVNLSFYSELDALYMDFDPEKLQRIIINLVHNAIKFTPEYGKILVIATERSTAATACLSIKVKDTGSGIPAEKLPHIFDRFYQADATHTQEEEIDRSSGGTGLGLALVKELVELMGGTIRVTSEVDKGTTFTIRLPIQRRAPLAPDLQHTPIKHGEENDIIPVNSIPNFSKEEAIVLLVEDNLDVLTYLRRCLKGRYQLLESRNGREGLAKARETIPDLVISDVMMPEMDGFTLCEMLKNDERTNHIPVVLLTAKATQTDRIEGLRRGADAYLAKPFQKEELLVRLEQLLELRRQLQEKYQANGEPDEVVEDPFLHRVRQTIIDHLDDTEFSVQQLSRELGMSRVQLHRKLKALAGQSASVLIRTIRLQRGRELLKDPALTIAEIAYRVGFKDPAHFSRLFSRHYDVPPSEWRG